MGMQNDDKRLKEINLLLKDIIRGDFTRVKEASIRAEKNTTYSLVCILGKMLAEVNDYANQLAKGNFSAQPPKRGNYLSMGIKSFHTKLSHLSWQLEQVAKGDYSQRIDYMGEISERFNWMTGQLQLRKAQSDYELSHDAATGLLNRGAFMRAAYNRIAGEPNKTGALLCCGLDNIKYINDTYGHEFGDNYIHNAAGIFKSFEEIGGIVSRISGDEFAIYIHGYESVKQTLTVVDDFLEERLNKSIFTIDAVEQRLRSSNGLAIYPDDARTISELIKYASYAMYEVKKNNRGALLRFDNINYSKKAHFFEKQEMLDKLIEDKLIRFAFQPIVRLSDGAIYGYEALMRPTTDKFSSPLEILKVAQEQSKLHQIEKLTFEKIFAWMQDNVESLSGERIFFNTISEYFLEESKLKEVNGSFGDFIGHMVFELLETSTNEDDFIDNIKRLRSERGLMLAIDDYGCGYSNNFRLLSIAPNILKMDRFFIKDIHKNLDKQYLLARIVSFCESKGMEILAEGVETREELDIVIQLGFDYAQGFYFAKPDFELKGIEREKIDSIYDLRKEE